MTEFPDIPGSRIAYGTCGTGPLVLLAHGPGGMRQAHRFLPGRHRRLPPP